MSIFETEAFLLHKIDYSNTSNIGYFFSKEEGVISAIVRGAKRANKKGAVAPVFLYRHLLISYTSKSELKTLRNIESIKDFSPMPRNMFILSYVNELLLKILPKGMCLLSIFDSYERLMTYSELEDSSFIVSMREMELEVLDSLGFPIIFDYEILSEKPIESATKYVFFQGQGFIKEAIANQYENPENDLIVEGRDIISISEGDRGPRALKMLKHINRQAISMHLKNPLNSRSVFEDLVFLDHSSNKK